MLIICPNHQNPTLYLRSGCFGRMAKEATEAKEATDVIEATEPIDQRHWPKEHTVTLI